MEKSTKDYDLEEAEIKDEILRYCQAQDSRALIDSVMLYTGILKGKMEQDRINYFLELIADDGYIKDFGSHDGFYQYDFSADKCIRNGGYTKALLDKRKLELGENIGSVLDAVISEAIDNNIKEDFYSISEGLNRIAKEFEKDEDVDWFNIGNSCRNVLKEFVKELITKSKIILDKGDKKADVKGLIKKHIANKIKSGHFRDTFVDLIDAVWEYVQPILHRDTTTKEEALRAFIWTTLSINEIVTLIGSDDSIKD